MANKALTMLLTRRIIQLLMEGCSLRENHRFTGIHRITIKNYLHRFQSSGQVTEFFQPVSSNDLMQAFQ